MSIRIEVSMADALARWDGTWTQADRAVAAKFIDLAATRFDHVRFYVTPKWDRPTIEGDGRRMVEFDSGAMYVAPAFGSLPEGMRGLDGLATRDRVIALDTYSGRGR